MPQLEVQTQEELVAQLRSYALKIYETVYEDLSMEFRKLEKECQFQMQNVGLPRSCSSACIKEDRLVNNVAMNMMVLMESLYRISYSIENNKELCSKYIDYVKQLVKDLMKETESLENLQKLLRKIHVTMNKVKKTKAVKLKRCNENEVNEMLTSPRS